MGKRKRIDGKDGIIEGTSNTKKRGEGRGSRMKRAGKDENKGQKSRGQLNGQHNTERQAAE